MSIPLVVLDERVSSVESAARPLLQLVQNLTGMETSFVTSIDWDAQLQNVMFALNSGEMQLPEGSSVAWKDSMCRAMFLAEIAQTSAVGVEVLGTSAAIALQFKSFLVVPISASDATIGTLCAATRKTITLPASEVANVQLVADALGQLLKVEQSKELAEARARHSERMVEQAHSEAAQRADDFEQMTHLAHTDALTGLPNRRSFMMRWEDELARSGRRHYSIGLLLIDADRFKNVNDDMGHMIGDSVLRAIGASLLEVAGPQDIVCRLGGDEFALAITYTDRARLFKVAENIRQLFAVAASELNVKTTLSVGIASSDYSPRNSLLADADQALYRSKGAGGDRAEIFVPVSTDGLA